MGDYTGRRRGRPAPEPAYQAPETPEYHEAYSQPNYFVDDAYYAEDPPVDDYYYPEAESQTAHHESQYADSYYEEPDYHSYAEPRLEPVRRRARESADVPEPRETPKRSASKHRPPRSGRTSSAAPPTANTTS